MTKISDLCIIEIQYYVGERRPKIEKKKKEGNLPSSHYKVLKDRIEELEEELESLKEKYENFKRDVEDNYRPVSVAEQIDYNEGW